MAEVFDITLRSAGPCFFMGMQVAALATAKRIHDNKSVGQLSALPFMSLLTNSVLWTMYGSLKADYTVLVPNFTGSVAGIICVYAYQAHSPPETYEAETKYYYMGAACIIFFGLVCSYYRDSETIGTLGIIMCVIMMGSPLAVLRTVLAQRNCNAMPFWTSLATWCNSLSWALYGLVIANDFMIYFPNFIGLSLATVQMFLYAVFGIPVNDRLSFCQPTSAVATSISAPAKGVPARTVYAPLNVSSPHHATYNSPAAADKA